MIGAVLAGGLLSVSGRFEALWPVALFAFVPLMLFLAKETKLHKGALATYTASLPITLVGYEGLVVLSPLAYCVAVIVCSLWYTLPGALTVFVGRRLGERAGLACFVASWVAVEALAAQTTLWGNFAYTLSVGYTQTASPLLAYAGLSGVAGVTTAVLLLNVSAVLLTKRGWGASAVVVTVIFGTALALNVGVGDSKEQTQLTIGVVQGLTSSAEQRVAQLGAPILERLLERFSQLTSAGIRSNGVPDFVVWPEATLPVYLVEPLPPYILRSFPTNTALLAGAWRYDTGTGDRYNSVVYWNGTAARYIFDKRYPVPLFESHFKPGRAVGPVDVRGAFVGLGICWDSLFYDLSRNNARRGARLLLYLSDDGFAGDSVTPWLHMRSTAVRAAEAGLPAVFASQSGPSAAFDSRGNRVSLAPHAKAGYYAFTVSVDGEPKPTLFVLLGNWMGGIWAFVAIALLVVASRPKIYRVGHGGGVAPRARNS